MLVTKSAGYSFWVYTVLIPGMLLGGASLEELPAGSAQNDSPVQDNFRLANVMGLSLVFCVQPKEDGGP